MKNSSELKIKITIGVLELINDSKIDKEPIKENLIKLANFYNFDKLTPKKKSNYNLNLCLINLLKNETPIKELIQKTLDAVENY